MSEQLILSYRQLKDILDFNFPKTESELIAKSENDPHFWSETYGKLIDAHDLIEKIQANTNALDPAQFRHSENLIKKIKASHSFFEKRWIELYEEELIQTGWLQENNIADEGASTLAEADKGHQKALRLQSNRKKLLVLMTLLAGIALDAYGKKHGRNVAPILKIERDKVNVNKQALAARISGKGGLTELIENSTKMVKDGLSASTISDEIRQLFEAYPEFSTDAALELEKLISKTTSYSSR
jgi:hypothetical protein